MSEYVSVSFGPDADDQFQLNPAETAELSREAARRFAIASLIALDRASLIVDVQGATVG